MSNGSIHSNQMVSVDIVSLLTKVPTDETLALARDKLVVDPLLEERTYSPRENLMDILIFCMETTFFWMGADIYRQKEGLAMG